MPALLLQSEFVDHFLSVTHTLRKCNICHLTLRSLGFGFVNLIFTCVAFAILVRNFMAQSFHGYLVSLVSQ